MDNRLYRIVFLGAPRAGKSTMMAAWCHVLLRDFDGQIDASSPSAQSFESVYRQWKDQIVDATVPGTKLDVTVNAKYRGVEFSVRMQDFSGEDLLDAAIDDSLAFAEAYKESVEAIRNADWIFHIVNPEHVLSGVQQNQFGALVFAKRLPAILGEQASVNHVTTLFSQADRLDNVKMDEAEKILTNDQTFELRQGTNLLRIGLMPKPQEGSDGIDVDHQLQMVINRVISTLWSGGVSRSGSTSYRGVRVAIALIAISIIGLTIFLQKNGSDGADFVDSEQWATLQQEFESLQQKVDGNPNYSSAQDLITRLDQWEAKVQETQPEKLPEVATDLKQMRSKLAKVERSKGIDSINDMVLETLQRHTEANLRRFYLELGERAKLAVKDRSNWEPEAIKQWDEISTFCDKVVQGFEVRLATSSFLADQWWTSYTGYSDVRLEIWKALPGDPVPFTADTSAAAPISTGWKKPIWDYGRNKYSVTFAGDQAPDASKRTLVTLDNQLWFRAVNYGTAWYSSVAAETISRGGPLGLDWFNRKQTSSHYNSELFIRIETDLVVPAPVQTAFRRYRSKNAGT